MNCPGDCTRASLNPLSLLGAQQVGTICMDRYKRVYVHKNSKRSAREEHIKALQVVKSRERVGRLRTGPTIEEFLTK